MRKTETVQFVWKFYIWHCAGQIQHSPLSKTLVFFLSWYLTLLNSKGTQVTRRKPSNLQVQCRAYSVLGGLYFSFSKSSIMLVTYFVEIYCVLWSSGHSTLTEWPPLRVFPFGYFYRSAWWGTSQNLVARVSIALSYDLSRFVLPHQVSRHTRWVKFSIMMT